MKIIFDPVVLSPYENDSIIGKKLKETFNLSEDIPYRIIRKSLDARKKPAIVWKLRIEADVDDATARKLLNKKGVSLPEEKPAVPPVIVIMKDISIIIVGSGPAGLFCALRLVASGAKVTVLERGRKVEERLMDIELLKTKGLLCNESNVLFGEGGAGTYSDGKLTTRTHRPEISWVFNKFIEMGAPEKIIYEQKPHLGTDRLARIIKNIRLHISRSGSSIKFNEKAVSLVSHKGRAVGVSTEAGNEYNGHAVVIATGHSARDTYEMLRTHGISMEKKGFSVGLRVEHPAALVNQIQYGDMAQQGFLPAAEFFMAFNNSLTGRGTYSFCMCPGGEIINSSSEQGMLCLNGMSFSARDGKFSNAALVVSVKPIDLDDDPLSGIAFQRSIEKAAYLAGGGGFICPGQRLTSFLSGNADSTLPASTYKPGITPSDITYLPSFIIDELKPALEHFNKKMKGFITDEALLLGAETRTSSPIKITRNDRLQSVSLPGLYPAGEGAGYSGGIVSSAVDGVRIADVILGTLF